MWSPQASVNASRVGSDAGGPPMAAAGAAADPASPASGGSRERRADGAVLVCAGPAALSPCGSRGLRWAPRAVWGASPSAVAAATAGSAAASRWIGSGDRWIGGGDRWIGGGDPLDRPAGGPRTRQGFQLVAPWTHQRFQSLDAVPAGPGGCRRPRVRSARTSATSERDASVDAECGAHDRRGLCPISSISPAPTSAVPSRRACAPISAAASSAMSTKDRAWMTRNPSRRYSSRSTPIRRGS